jgi:hypothetical protein
VTQRGFLSPLLIASIAAAVVIGGLGIALKVQSARLESEQERHKATRAAYEAFVTDTKRIGVEAQKKADAERIRQDQVSKERGATYEKRLAAVNDAYRRLRDSRSGSGGGELPAIPTTARSVDDTARDNQLLDLLQHAESQAVRLQELQGWVTEQAK